MQQLCCLFNSFWHRASVPLLDRNQEYGKEGRLDALALLAHVVVSPVHGASRDHQGMKITWLLWIPPLQLLTLSTSRIPLCSFLWLALEGPWSYIWTGPPGTGPPFTVLGRPLVRGTSTPIFPLGYSAKKAAGDAGGIALDDHILAEILNAFSAPQLGHATCRFFTQGALLPLPPSRVDR